MILSVEEENKKVSLGIKQLAENPWNRIESDYPVGSTIEGEVSKIANFGAFVKLNNGIEGLLHVSEAEAEGKKLQELVTVGQKYKFRVVNINQDEQKISLSLDLEGKRSVKTKAAAPKIKEEKPKSAFQAELERLKNQK